MFHKLNRSIFNNPALKNIFVYGFGQLFNLVTPLLVVPYIVKTCGDENFGKIAVGMALAFFLIVFVDYGSDLIGVRDVSINRNNSDKLQEVLTTNLSSRGFVLIIVAFSALLLFLINSYFSEEKALFILSFSIVVGQYLNPTWALQGLENVKWITINNIISKSIYLFLVFFFIKDKSDYIYVNLFWGMGMIISNSVFLFLMFKFYNLKFIPSSFSTIKDFLKKNFKIFSSQIFLSLQLNAPLLFIGYFGNNIMAVQYKIIEQVITVFKTYTFLFFNYTFPKICYLLDKDVKKGISVWKLYNILSLLFIISAMTICYYFSYEIVSYFNPANVSVLSDLLRVAVLIPIVMSVSVSIKQLILAWNLNKSYIRITSVFAIFNLVLILVAIKFHTIYGVFYSLILTEVLIIIFYILSIRKQYSFLQRARQIN